MGYRGTNSFDERDKLFGEVTGDRNKAKKGLESLFAPKATPGGPGDACAGGHAWIRDWDRQYKCVRCKTPKPGT
ncbi:MAG TPA: hypothetical protein VHO02_05900 [Fibrobacteria bacterium]|jgi:hypothetical protein|nr:hypothetical protein [Fibrobacteria bacterium]